MTLTSALALLPQLHTIRCPSSSMVPYELVCQAEVLGRACGALKRVNDCVRVVEADREAWRVERDARTGWERVTL